MKTDILIIPGQKKMKEVKRNPEFFSGWGSSRSRAKWAFWSPSRRKRLSLDLFPVYLLIFAGQDHGQFLANCSKLFLTSYHPWYPAPSPTAMCLIHSLPRIQIFPAKETLEMVSRSKHSVYKVHSGVCRIITLHFAQWILNQYLLYSKCCAGFMGSTF